MPTAQPVAPYSGVSDAITLATARSIKPTLNHGELLLTLLRNKNTSDDRKGFLYVPISTLLGRAMLFATSAVNGTVLSGATLIGTFTRDDATKGIAPVPFTFAGEGGLSADKEEIRVRLASIVEGSVQGDYNFEKPKRTATAMVNAISDAITKPRLDGDLVEVELPNVDFAIVIDQTDDGTIKVYGGPSIGTLTGKLADVEQVSEADPTVESDL